MPELRRDPIEDRWVIVATERARRPGNFVERVDFTSEDAGAACMFCQKTTSACASYGDIDVLYSDIFSEGEAVSPLQEKGGLYAWHDGFGTHEIIVETPEHVGNMAALSLERVGRVVGVWAERLKRLRGKETRYAMIYKNYGPITGWDTVLHTRSHLLAADVAPLRVQKKIEGAKKYFDASGRCIYCDLLRQESTGKRLVAETQHFMALVPFAARFLMEVWILPKDHRSDFDLTGEEEQLDLARILKLMLRKFQAGIDDAPYSFVLQTAPMAEGHKDYYHWHVELTPRLTRMAGFEKGTDFFICSVPPEDMAEYLKSIKVEPL